MTRKKLISYSLIIILLIIAIIITWMALASKTYIAFVNYRAITLGQIARANDNSFISISELPVEKLDDASDFDMVFVNGMGLRLTEEERAALLKCAENGTPVLTTMATNPQNMITSLDSLTALTLESYLSGGRNNYRNMLNYVRTNIDKKRFFINNPDEPAEPQLSMFYYPDENDGLNFSSVTEYKNFLRSTGRLNESAPGIIVTGHMGVPDSFVASLERKGFTVWPVNSIRGLIASGQTDSIRIDAVINMAHGRMGDIVTQYLRRNNILLFSPLNVNHNYDEWIDDKKGMTGGFLSQSVVTPEIDGALRPFVLFAHFLGDDGLEYVEAIPDRLDDFTETVSDYLSLRAKPNNEKRIAIFYFKGPGQHALVAEGLEVAPSLFNLLKRLKSEGYNTGNLPETATEFEKLLNENGKLFNDYAQGAKSEFVARHSPEIISESDYKQWCSKAISSEMLSDIDAVDGAFPGHGLSDGNGNMALPRLTFGNIKLIPQPAAGLGDDDFKIVHGTDQAPPHEYVAAYLWARYGFDADALIHFGTHGSLEFTPRKQVALSSNDWPDRLVGTMPHIYVYSTSNVGEAMIAKRRTYAALVNYLTPPFMESNVRTIYKNLSDAIADYNRLAFSDNPDQTAVDKAAATVKKFTIELGIHRDLRLDSITDKIYTADEIARIENFAEELANEKITGANYIMGKPYEKKHINSTVHAMTVDPIAFGIHRLRGGNLKDHRDRAARIIDRLLSTGDRISDVEICNIAGISQNELDSLTNSDEQPDEHAIAVMDLVRALRNIGIYADALNNSPEHELSAIVNALAGGYTAPTPGGDPVLNPNVLPTGRNMYAINAEQTPSPMAWEKGKNLAESTIDMYRKTHNDSIPHKVSYTLWSSEFIETEGATIAQILYMLGIEPIRDPFGRVTDLRIIPSEELNRPRIDVVVQTSGQLRDLAASRLFLIDRAVKMASAAENDKFPNYVHEGAVNAERHLVSNGVTPKEARELSTARVFGGVNGNYGSGIQGLVESGDKWEDESEIASTYLHNMGAVYGSEEDWEQLREHAFEAALIGTDVVVQPRQSNTWGVLSLDHVYEFMGGMNLAVRNVTGKDPDAYLSDYRNRNNVRMQDVKESIGIESRTTILNPTYIAEKMKGGAGDASAFAGVIKNTYGWNVMKPDAIDNQLWNDIYDTYVLDKNNLGIGNYFRGTNPAALQEMTAVMLESARKGLWSASENQIHTLAELHTELIKDYGAACSGFVCDNAKLRDFISQNVESEKAQDYNASISSIRAENIDPDNAGMVMKKEELNGSEIRTNHVSGLMTGIAVVIALIAILLLIRHRRKNNE